MWKTNTWKNQSHKNHNPHRVNEPLMNFCTWEAWKPVIVTQLPLTASRIKNMQVVWRDCTRAFSRTWLQTLMRWHFETTCTQKIVYYHLNYILVTNLRWSTFVNIELRSGLNMLEMDTKQILVIDKIDTKVTFSKQLQISLRIMHLVLVRSNGLQ